LDWRRRLDVESGDFRFTFEQIRKRLLERLEVVDLRVRTEGRFVLVSFEGVLRADVATADDGQ